MGTIHEIEAARQREYATRPEDVVGISQVLEKKFKKPRRPRMLMKVIADNAGAIVVAPAKNEDRWYFDGGVAAHVSVDNVRKGAVFEFRCNNTKMILFRQTLAANRVMIYLPRLAEGYEYELEVKSDNYGQVNKIFRRGHMSPMNQIKLTQRAPLKKLGWLSRIKNTIGW